MLVVVVVFVVGGGGGGGGGGGLILFFVGLVFLWYVYICFQKPCTYCGWISKLVYIYTQDFHGNQNAEERMKECE